MVDPLTYFAAGSLLFGFWAYGLVSFALDVKNKFIPLVREYRRERQEKQTQERREQEREERERQLL
ncbi:hypothetical protein [Natronomonas sp. EA1]|uniref:hypothetical protein n=1 Tax=Natronomonas sp. EA1 TaxID=3421655 RepID=UPI003EBF622B